MPQPPAYSPSTDFSDEERDNVGGRSTVRTAALDAELSAIALTLSQVLTNLALNQRDDGEIRDGRVKLFALASDVLALLTSYGASPRGAWLTGTAYALKDLVSQSGNTYIAVSAHTSGVFATDLAAGKWLLFSLGAAPGATQVTFTPTGGIAATNVQTALAEVDSEYRAADTTLQNNINTANAALATLIADLANTASATKGAGMVGLNQSLAYDPSALGYQASEFYDPTCSPWLAKNDGSADAATAINACLAACETDGRAMRWRAGRYRCDSTIIKPPKVAIICDAPGDSLAASFSYSHGTWIIKNHNGDALTSTGSVAYESASPIYGLGIDGGARPGRGIVLDKLANSHLYNCRVYRTGGRSFQVGVTAGDVTGHNYLYTCYSNSSGAESFYIRAKWSRLYDPVSDGGTYAIYCDNAPETSIINPHGEGWTTGGIRFANACTNSVVSGHGYLNNTTATTGITGITLDNASGNTDITIENTKVDMNGAATTTGVSVAAGATNTTIFNNEVKGAAIGVDDNGSDGTQILSNLFDTCALPIKANSTATQYLGNRMKSTTGSWSIDHIGAGGGIWKDNVLDQLIKATSSGVAGNFGTNLVKDNKGHKTRTSGVTGSIASGTSIAHGLGNSATPTRVAAFPYSPASYTNFRVGTLDGTNIQFLWDGGGSLQIQWEALATCETTT